MPCPNGDGLGAGGEPTGDGEGATAPPKGPAVDDPPPKGLASALAGFKYCLRRKLVLKAIETTV